MAELTNGPLGFISGKVGNMVASNWRQISYLRGLGRKSKKDPSDAQKETQMRLTLLQEFLTGIKDVLNIGFGNKNTGRQTTTNLAFQANSKAIKGVFPEIEIDFSKLQLSTGKLFPLFEQKMTVLASGNLQLSWNAMAEFSRVNQKDKLQVLVCNPALNLQVLYENIALRSAESIEINLPEAFKASELHVYAFVVAEDGTQNSVSLYFHVNP